LQETFTISISIYRIYIAPLQGNYSEALPAQVRAGSAYVLSIRYSRMKFASSRSFRVTFIIV